MKILSDEIIKENKINVVPIAIKEAFSYKPIIFGSEMELHKNGKNKIKLLRFVPHKWLV